MAHRESIQSPTFAYLMNGEPFFWTVSSSVGYGCRNKPEDVLLVQFFLNRYIDACFDEIVAGVIAGDIKHKNPFSLVPKKLVPDGDFGGKTWGAIKWYQASTGYCVADGMVSACDGTSALTPKSKRWYTILILNSDYRSICPNLFSDIRCDPSLPSLLCDHLTGPLTDLD